MTPRQRWLADIVLHILDQRGPSCIHEIAMGALETPPYRGYATQAHYQQVRNVLTNLEADGQVSRRRYVGPGGSDMWERTSVRVDMSTFEDLLNGATS